MLISHSERLIYAYKNLDGDLHATSVRTHYEILVCTSVIKEPIHIQIVGCRQKKYIHTFLFAMKEHMLYFVNYSFKLTDGTSTTCMSVAPLTYNKRHLLAWIKIQCFLDKKFMLQR